MKSSSLLLVGLDPGERAIAIEAAQSQFPEVLVADLPGADEFSLVSPGGDGGFVIVAGGTAGQVAQAIRASDEAGLPRWAVVVVGETAVDDAAGFVPRGEWSVRSAAQVFCSAALLHAARRENARLRGDLKTVATRFTHDVRSPLGVILTTCELIKELGEVPDAAQLRVITSSVDEVSHLVARVAIVLRATADPKPAETFDMSEIVFRALQRIEYECPQQQVAVVVPEKWPVVRGVARNIEVVWDCLLAHAITYGGASPRLRMGWSRSAGDCAFWVEACGPIPSDLHDGIFFRPFHLLHQQDDGGGIELSIVQRLIELHGGRCVVEPRPDSGSRFLFTLPCPVE